MGALTLGIVLPAGLGPEGPLEGSESMRARSADQVWAAAERRSAIDLREAARALGLACEIVAIPAFSDAATFEIEPITELLRRRLGHADLVMIAANGPLGGSGALHAAARACGLPVLGPGALAIERGFDKLRARAVLARHNLPVPTTLALGVDVEPEAIERLGWPCVIKPRRGVGGSGVHRLDHPAAIAAAVVEPRGHRGDRLLERELVGRELAVVVVGGRVLGIAEIDREAIDREQLDRAELRTTMICPPQLDAIARVGIENLARRACAALDLIEGPTRVDMIVSERGNEAVLEVEPLPPLHRDGVIARVARAAGLSYPRLCAQILAGRVPAPAPAPTRSTPTRSNPARSAPSRSAATRSAPARSAPTRSAPARSAPTLGAPAPA